MSHRSRLTAVLVDVPHERHQSSVAFWAGALGRAASVSPEYAEYAQLGPVSGSTEFTVQSVGTGRSGMHVDIETDDVDAEVARLGLLGAVETARHKGWVVMADPAGTAFCVVPIQTPDAFEREATAWS